MAVSPTDRDAVAKAELEARQRQAKAVELFRQYVPGCEKAFIARTSPKLCIRRGRLIECDYDITLPDVLEGRHFDDDVMVYGFHDSAPRLQIKDGGTYGIPYRALRVKGIDNLLAAGMMITSDHEAHMSTRNTVCCMGQGQAAGTAGGPCAQKNLGTRELRYADLRKGWRPAACIWRRRRPGCRLSLRESSAIFVGCHRRAGAGVVCHWLCQCLGRADVPCSA